MYIFSWENVMTTKVFQTGNSLAVRLPKALNVVKNCEFSIRLVDKNIILTPINSSWNSTLDAIDNFKGEIKREDLSAQNREWE